MTEEELSKMSDEELLDKWEHYIKCEPADEEFKSISHEHRKVSEARYNVEKRIEKELYGEITKRREEFIQRRKMEDEADFSSFHAKYGLPSLQAMRILEHDEGMKSLINRVAVEVGNAMRRAQDTLGSKNEP